MIIMALSKNPNPTNGTALCRATKTKMSWVLQGSKLNSCNTYTKLQIPLPYNSCFEVGCGTVSAVKEVHEVTMTIIMILKKSWCNF